MKKLGIVLILIVACTVLLFAAPATETGGGTESSAQNLSGEIVISIIASDYSKVAADALIAAYNKQNPNVKVLWEPVSADYPSWLSTQLAADIVRPDIVSGNYVKSYGEYLDLNKYRYTTNRYTGKTWDEDFDFTHIEAALTLPDGKRYLVGTQAVDILWVYNADIFKKVGVSAPKTWDEFAAVCKAIAAAGYTPIGINYNWLLPQWVSQAYWQQYDQPIKEIAKSKPGDFNYDPNVDYMWNVARFYQGVRDGTIRYDTPEMVEYITNLKKVFPQYATEDLYITDQTYPLFLQQQVAIIIESSPALGRIKTDMANLANTKRLEELKIDPNAKLQTFDWGIFPHPPMTGGLVNAPNRVFASIVGEYIAVVEKTQQQTDLVMDFLKFWLSAPGYDAWVAGYLGGERSWEPGGPVLVRGVDIPPKFQEMFDNLGLDKKENNPMTNPDRLLTTVTGGNAGVQAEAYELFRKVLDDEITSRQFADGFQALLKDNLPKILNAINLAPERLDHPERGPSE